MTLNVTEQNYAKGNVYKRRLVLKAFFCLKLIVAEIVTSYHSPIDFVLLILHVRGPSYTNFFFVRSKSYEENTDFLMQLQSSQLRCLRNVVYLSFQLLGGEGHTD